MTFTLRTSASRSPKIIHNTGIGDWLDNAVVGTGTNRTIDADGQLFTGAFATPLLHDIWVNKGSDGRIYAVLSYWDAGFVTLDITDPTAPIFMGDSTYPATDPIHRTSPSEGNAHAAVFGGANLEYILGGDEDFGATQITIKAGGGTFNASKG